MNIKLHPIALATLFCAFIALPAPAQQATTSDSPAASPAQSDSTPTPVKKHKKSQQDQNGGGKKLTKQQKKQLKKEKADAGKPPVAVCNDGTMSHEHKTGKNGKAAKPCTKNGGVQKMF